MYFGPRWDAPIIDDITAWDGTPTHARCLTCSEQIADGDQGFVIPHAGQLDPQYAVTLVPDEDYALTAQHRECFAIGVLGHVVGVCSCTGWDTRARATGREVLQRIQEGALRR